MRTPIVLLLAGAVLAGCAAPAARTGPVPLYTRQLAATVEPGQYPYVAEHSRNGRRLAFVAAAHSSTPGSPTHLEVRRAFERIRPAAVIIEGIPSSWGENPAPIVELARMTDDPGAEPYARGEAGYAASLALASGVPFMGGEPTERDQTTALIAQGFSPLDIFYTDLIKLLPQSIRGGEITALGDVSFERAFAHWTTSLALERNDAPDVDLDGFARWYQVQYGLDYRTDPLFDRRADPGAETLPGRILQAQALIRDQHLLDLILRTVRKRDRVLVVYGGTHRATLAQALSRELGPAVVWPGQPVLTPVAGAGSAAGR
ncbi:MAG: hypothetical protein KY449_02930 [Proteobacteria bacterium]|nr:hypothetical protein [Pseudomonadota bacterium]